MTARIEIGRLAAKDLGKWVTFDKGAWTGELVSVAHYGTGQTDVLVQPGGFDTFPSDTLIEVTGTNNKEQDV